MSASEKPAVWGISLRGHKFDLADWAEVLKPPFDPHVERAGSEYILRWTGFDFLTTADESYEAGSLLLEQLNGAMRIERQSRRVEFGGAVEFTPDGKRNVVMFAGTAESRSRAHGVMVALSVDGTPIPQPPPQPSKPQKWLTQKSSERPLIVDMLVHLGKEPGWYDLYKAFEQVRRLSGGEKGLQQKPWAPSAKALESFKRTADYYYRHAYDPGKTPPPRTMSLREAATVVTDMANSLLREVSP